jgi:DNA-binding MarR family transcriptional regulator
MCEFMGMDKAAVSRSADLLKKRGLVFGSAPMGRRIELHISTGGVELYNEILAVALQREEALLEGFTDDERLQLTRFLHRMLANLPVVVQRSADIVASRGPSQGD